MKIVTSEMFCLFLLVFTVIILSKSEKVTYLSLEHPSVTFYNTTFLSMANLTSSRRGRGNSVYYVGLNFHALVWFGNNLTFDFFFYEFLSNQYKPSFVEMKFKFCNLIHKDSFFGPAFRQGNLDRPCPYPPGPYNLNNMTINPSVIPAAFPFRKGRIYANSSFPHLNALVATGYIDMEIKQLNRKMKVGENLK